MTTFTFARTATSTWSMAFELQLESFQGSAFCSASQLRKNF